MKPVTQSITRHSPAEGLFGDCLSAAIASIFEVTLQDLPNFNHNIYDQGQEGGSEQHRRVNAWLKPRGYILVWMPLTTELIDQWDRFFKQIGADVYHLLGGISPRGHGHVVVARNFLPVHDPHPEGGGLEPDSDGTYGIGFFIKANKRSDKEPA